MNKKVFAIFGFILVYLSYIPLGLWIVEPLVLIIEVYL